MSGPNEPRIPAPLGQGVVKRIRDGRSITVSQKVIQPNVKTNSLTCWDDFFHPFYTDAELDSVAISSTDNPHSLASRQEHRSASHQSRLI